MSNFNPDQIFQENQKIYFDSENPNINFFIKFALVIDIIIRKNNFILKSDIKQILQNELNKKSKLISLEYDHIEADQQNQETIGQNESLGTLRLDIIDHLIGSFAGKLDVNANYKSIKNASNQNYFIPINCISQELKNLRFEKLNETYSPLEKFIYENLIDRIFSMNNLNKLTINLNNNTNRIYKNHQTGFFNNLIAKNDRIYISDNNFKFNKNTMDKVIQINPIFSEGIPNIHSTSEEISVDKKTDLGINKNIFHERNKEEIYFDNKHQKHEKLNSEDIYNREINANNIENPRQIGGNRQLEVPFHKQVPKQDYWDPIDPNCEVFNPNYQINPNKYINPNYNEGNFIKPGGNNPFFSTEGGMIPGGDLIGPGSDIFSKGHPHMKNKPGAKIRYDPIGPFGTFGGPDKGSKHDDPFQG
jgi:hypothetical protein